VWEKRGEIEGKMEEKRKKGPHKKKKGKKKGTDIRSSKCIGKRRPGPIREKKKKKEKGKRNQEIALVKGAKKKVPIPANTVEVTAVEGKVRQVDRVEQKSGVGMRKKKTKPSRLRKVVFYTSDSFRENRGWGGGKGLKGSNGKKIGLDL